MGADIGRGFLQHLERRPVGRLLGIDAKQPYGKDLVERGLELASCRGPNGITRLQRAFGLGRGRMARYKHIVNSLRFSPSTWSATI